MIPYTKGVGVFNYGRERGGILSIFSVYSNVSENKAIVGLYVTTQAFFPLLQISESSTQGLKSLPHYQINYAPPALSLSFRGRLQYISRLRAQGLALLIC